MKTYTEAVRAAQRVANDTRGVVAVNRHWSGEYHLVQSAADVMPGDQRVSVIYPNKEPRHVGA